MTRVSSDLKFLMFDDFWNQCALRVQFGGMSSRYFDLTAIVPGDLGLWGAPVRATFSDTVVGLRAAREGGHLPLRFDVETSTGFGFRRLPRRRTYVRPATVVDRGAGLDGHMELRDVVRYVASVASSQRARWR